MNAPMNSAMLEALRLTRAGHLFEATALIQRALHGGHGNEPAASSTPTETLTEREVFLMDAKPAANRARHAPRTADAPIDTDFVIADVEPDPAAKSSGSCVQPCSITTSGSRWPW